MLNIKFKISLIIFLFLSITMVSCKNKKTDLKNIPIIIKKKSNVQADNSISNPIVKNIYSVSEDIIAVQIEAQEIIYGDQIQYKKEKNDVTVLFWENPIYNGQIKRNGKILGPIIGKNKNIVKLYDKIIGIPLDTSACKIINNYTIQSDDDLNYKNGKKPKSVYLKCKPNNMAWLGEWHFDYTTTNTIYLKLNNKMEIGSKYKINFKNININNKEVIFTYNPYNNWSESVHLSQIGFNPDDPAKIGYLSIWLGTGGKYSYPEKLSFSIINNTTDKIEYTGKINTIKRTEEKEPGKFNKNYNKTDVYLADFSDFNKPGEYRLYINGIGCSYPFKINNDVWFNAFKIAARGFYHQRNGINLEAPYTDYIRPRPMHPDDGFKIYQSDYSFMELEIEILETYHFSFDKIRKKSSNNTIDGAWGGYMDAGDWDRNINHLDSTLNLFELYTLFPDYFENIDLNIPESSNHIPDIIDEGLWNLDLYYRLQLTNGSVRGGIESAEHPQYGEASWQESLTLLAFAPDIWSTYYYTIAAARAAFVLKDIDQKLSNKYKDSALKAMEWAETEYKTLDNNLRNKFINQINEKRNLASLELFRLLGDNKWHSIFKETTIYTNSKSLITYHTDQSQAAFLYTQIKNRNIDTNIVNNIKEAFNNHSKHIMRIIDDTAFKFYFGKRDFIGWGSTTAINAENLLRNYLLTNDKKYLRYSIYASQFSLGANPLNLCFTTGMGSNSPKNPLITDMRMMGKEPPAGITLYGPIDFDGFYDITKYFLMMNDDKCIPHPREWPNTESYFDIYWAADMCEFTIKEQMSPVTWIFGFLAACNR